MPDLGSYATEILLAYALSLGVLALLILGTWIRSRRVKRALADLEARQTRG
ncbi:heme exporter protein CcmD [Rhodobacter sp. NTK016B]|uniref:heme exporter protein CcmD n=1 Tax=Rhodobacter sp. NTK016B TaxID=2759676 RepID=UPI0032E3AE1A